jgi:hypothetical protein
MAHTVCVPYPDINNLPKLLHLPWYKNPPCLPHYLLPTPRTSTFLLIRVVFTQFRHHLKNYLNSSSVQSSFSSNLQCMNMSNNTTAVYAPIELLDDPVFYIYLFSCTIYLPSLIFQLTILVQIRRHRLNDLSANLVINIVLWCLDLFLGLLVGKFW